MISLVANNIDAIRDLCRGFNVATLEVFGSAVDGSFDEARSDVDFVVEFKASQSLGPWMAHYLDFKSALERLLGLNVDLVMTKAVKNPYFVREADKTRRVLYAA